MHAVLRNALPVHFIVVKFNYTDLIREGARTHPLMTCGWYKVVRELAVGARLFVYSHFLITQYFEPENQRETSGYHILTLVPFDAG